MEEDRDYEDVKEKMKALDDEELLEVENFSHALGYGRVIVF